MGFLVVSTQRNMVLVVSIHGEQGWTLLLVVTEDKEGGVFGWPCSRKQQEAATTRSIEGGIGLAWSSWPQAEAGWV
jgi:hypothetical protein